MAKRQFSNVINSIGPETDGTVMALSLKEPWASFVRVGDKSIETRKWKTEYRGDILILASRGFDKENFPNEEKSQFQGKAVAVVTLVGIEVMKPEHETRACIAVYPGAYAWFLENIRPIVPFDAKGALSLFNYEIKKGQIIYESV